ncbi:MAG: DUF3795 domain-containing protein [Anaerolineae bacterium]|nr:DUF3795 domain-containing protein [Anaerolineae bacterium]
MIDEMVAYCGLDCAACPAYRATQTEDLPRLETLALEWFGEANAANAACDGCLTANRGRLNRWCRECPLRACARAMGIRTCAFCADYPDCRHLQKMFSHTPDAKARLDALRTMLR